jgi:hypothetical protein
LAPHRACDALRAGHTAALPGWNSVCTGPPHRGYHSNSTSEGLRETARWSGCRVPFSVPPLPLCSRTKSHAFEAKPSEPWVKWGCAENTPPRHHATAQGPGPIRSPSGPRSSGRNPASAKETIPVMAEKLQIKDVRTQENAPTISRPWQFCRRQSQPFQRLRKCSARKPASAFGSERSWLLRGNDPRFLRYTLVLWAYRRLAHIEGFRVDSAQKKLGRSKAFVESAMTLPVRVIVT